MLKKLLLGALLMLIFGFAPLSKTIGCPAFFLRRVC